MGLLISLLSDSIDRNFIHLSIILKKITFGIIFVIDDPVKISPTLCLFVFCFFFRL